MKKIKSKYILHVGIIAAFFSFQCVVADTLEESAKNALDSNKISKAISLYHRLVQEHPENIEFKFKLASVYAHSGEWSVAEEINNKALLLDPKNLDMLYLSAKLALWETSWEEAKRRFERVLFYYPNFVDGYSGLSKALDGLGLEDESKAAFSQYEKLFETKH